MFGLRYTQDAKSSFKDKLVDIFKTLILEFPPNAIYITYYEYLRNKDIEGLKSFVSSSDNTVVLDATKAKYHYLSDLSIDEMVTHCIPKFEESLASSTEIKESLAYKELSELNILTISRKAKIVTSKETKVNLGEEIVVSEELARISKNLSAIMCDSNSLEIAYKISNNQIAEKPIGPGQGENHYSSLEDYVTKFVLTEATEKKSLIVKETVKAILVKMFSVYATYTSRLAFTKKTHDLNTKYCLFTANFLYKLLSKALFTWSATNLPLPKVIIEAWVQDLELFSSTHVISIIAKRVKKKKATSDNE